MNTHTIRNKASATPIISLTPTFLEVILASRSESVALTLSYLFERYKELTGKKARLDHLQEVRLLAHANAREDGTWTSRYSCLTGTPYKVLYAFQQGLQKMPSMSVEEVLAIAQEFYAMVDVVYADELAKGEG